MLSGIIKSCWPACVLLAGLSVSNLASEIRFQTFEDDTTQGWTLNTEGWAGGFSALENSRSNATEGIRSLRARFSGQTRRWGAYRKELSDPLPAWALQFGGTLLVDVTVPAASAAVQEIGVSFQQPDIIGALNWQEVWQPIGQAGSFTIAVPVRRTGSAPPTIHLGQTAPAGSTFEIFADNIRFLPNPPPVKAFVVARDVQLFSFESGADRFEPSAFATIDSSAGPATGGARSLAVSFTAGARAFAATRTSIYESSILSEIERGGTLLVDVIVPNASGLTEIGLALNQTDAPPIDQVWIPVTGAGTSTLSLPFIRRGFAPLEISLGRNSTAPGAVFFDRVRLRIDESIGGSLGSIALEPMDSSHARVHYSGALESAPTVNGPFTPIAAGANNFDIDLTAGQGIFRARDWPGILFSDDLEATNQWNHHALWRRVEGFAHSDRVAFGTAHTLSAGYPESQQAALLSPVIDLSNAGGARLTFYQILDLGSEFEADAAEIFVRDENGAPLPGATAAFSQASKRSDPLSWERRELDLPIPALGKKVRLEFLFLSDSFTPIETQAGWFLDDIRVTLKP